MQFKWADIEPTIGVFDFSVLDKKLSNCYSEGV
jgi:hypothetical protein